MRYRLTTAIFLGPANRLRFFGHGMETQGGRVANGCPRRL
jgi:hypothetical protein